MNVSDRWMDDPMGGGGPPDTGRSLGEILEFPARVEVLPVVCCPRARGWRSERRGRRRWATGGRRPE